MNSREILHVLLSILIFAVVISFTSIIIGDWVKLGLALLFAAIIITVNVTAKKVAAASLDADIEHNIWMWSRYGFKPGWKIEAIPAGVILPLVMTAFSLGVLKCSTFLSYETKALKRRAAKRFGFYSFSEMTDWHNALIGAAGIASVLALAFVFYWIPGFEGLPKMAAYYAFWNMIPFSKLDGTQILFGSKVLYTALALVTLVFALGAFIIP